MSRAVLVMAGRRERDKAHTWIEKAPVNSRVEFKAAQRTVDQNAAMWAHLTDVADQLSWHGVKLNTGDWKLVFMESLDREMRIVPNIDGTGFVQLSRSSSDLSVSEMSDLIELIRAFGAEHGVVFSTPSDGRG